MHAVAYRANSSPTRNAAARAAAPIQADGGSGLLRFFSAAGPFLPSLWLSFFTWDDFGVPEPRLS